MDEWLFRIVGDGVRNYLDGVVARARVDRGPLAPEAGRAAAAWRTLLRLHDEAGCCAACGKRSLCLVWQVAVGYFLRRIPGD